MTMKWHEIGSRALVALGALIAVTGTALAVESPTAELMGRVESVRPGGQEFTVTDRDGNRIQVVRPARPPQAASLERDGDLVNATALHEGETVLIAGAHHGDWIEARRVELLSAARLGAATTTARVLRLTGSVNGRQLTAVDPNGAEYRILFPPRPQMVSVWKTGNLVDLSALREADRVIPYGTEQGHLIRADRLEVLEESRVGGGAAVPLRLTYRGTEGWRRLIGEAADGSRYTVLLPRRPQAVYLVRRGTLVDPSTLQPGDTMEVRGLIRGAEIQASKVSVR
jgi:hypothetical protein